MKRRQNENLSFLTVDSGETMKPDAMGQIGDIVAGLFLRRFFKENELMELNEEKRGENFNVHLANV